MKTLILLRHAKSSWKHGGLSDHDRPLNKRGRASAPVMAGWLIAKGYLPDTILCSSSARTQETVALMRASQPALPHPAILPELYHAGFEMILASVRDLPESTATAMLVAHEPGMSQATRSFATEDVPDRCVRAFGHFPTAAAAIFEFDVGDWDQVSPGTGRFIDFAVPRELLAD